MNGHGCPKCSGNVGISHEEFLQRMETINPNIEINGLYEKQANKIPGKCKICGYVWTPTAGSLLSGHGCPRCVGKARIKPDEFVQRIALRTPITVRCKQCGYEWNASPSNLKNGSGCPRCKRKLKKTNEQFIQELSEVNSCVEPLEEYVGAHTKIKVRCEKCGREWFSSPNTLLRGNGCRICARLIKKIQVE